MKKSIEQDYKKIVVYQFFFIFSLKNLFFNSQFHWKKFENEYKTYLTQSIKQKTRIETQIEISKKKKKRTNVWEAQRARVNLQETSVKRPSWWKTPLPRSGSERRQCHCRICHFLVMPFFLLITMPWLPRQSRLNDRFILYCYWLFGKFWICFLFVRAIIHKLL